MDYIISFFPEVVKKAVGEEIKAGYVTEIRLCLNKPVLVVSNGRIKVLDVVVDRKLMEYTVSALTRGSLYSEAENIRNGYITIDGGHRVGIGGTAVVENNTIKNIKDISFLCFRISREIKGCASKIAPAIIKNGRVASSLIVSPPGYGKTTIIRDIARMLGDGLITPTPLRVGIADERREISPLGQKSFDTGTGTFVLSGYPRCVSMGIMLRTMSPDVIITDEIGNTEDFDIVSEATRFGIAVIATAHGSDIDDIAGRFGKRTECFDKIFFIEDKTGNFTVAGR